MLALCLWTTAPASKLPLAFAHPNREQAAVAGTDLDDLPTADLDDLRLVLSPKSSRSSQRRRGGR
jgi:hypothetical protein